MTKTLNQLGQLTQVDDADLLLVRDTSTGDDKYVVGSDFLQRTIRNPEDVGDQAEHEAPTGVEKAARLDRLINSGQINTGLTESVTLSTGTLTIPVGMSTIKLPSAVWDGSSNITISGFAFENGVQPEPGYEFALVIPRTGVASAGALGNEVLLQHGASLQVSANGFADLPCYPNAADNPDQDAVQYAAPYYRLKMRVESYDGGGDPVVSVEELPGAIFVTNDRGSLKRFVNGHQLWFDVRDFDFEGDSFLTMTHIFAAPFANTEYIASGLPKEVASGEIVCYAGGRNANPSGARWSLATNDGSTTTDIIDVSLAVQGDWY